uniref:trypsin n=1 Tax=Manduca sexta TaxID=7130 RepID=O44333_MANSE|nr:hemocyte protease-4 [Manduca sexta]
MGGMQLFWALCFINYIDALSVHHPMVGVAGGHEIPISDAPFVASIIRYKNKTQPKTTVMIFGGSVIHERFILTAAHCFLMYENLTSEVIRVGSAQLGVGGTTYEVEKVIIHENFNPNNNMSLAFSHDIALLKLKEKYCLHEMYLNSLADKDLEIVPYTLANVTGWVDLAIRQYFKDTTASISRDKPIDECKMYPWACKDEICIKSYNKGSCKGDSGGPLTMHGVQVGIVSNGLGCGTMPTIHTKISFLRPWIDENIRKNLQDHKLT